MSDTYKTITCPACGTTMRKIYIPETGINIDICLDGCGGIFFDNREYKLYDEQYENLAEIIKEAESKTFNKKVDEDIDRICPACGAKMVKNPTSTNQTIIIDECYSCGGKFFDHGELTKFRSEYATEKERSEAAIQALIYSAEGGEILGLSNNTNKVNKRMEILNNSLYGKLMDLIINR